MQQDFSSGQLAFALAGEDKASFENFWVGDNQELVTALRVGVTQSEPKVIYFYGSPGCGKSHLLYAAMRLAKHEAVRTSYLSLKDKYVSPAMLDVIDVGSMVCIDDIHAWAGDHDKERALFTLFEQIKHAGGQLMVSAAQAPEISEFVIRDLVSRLSSGLIYAMYSLSDEQRFEALKMRSNHRGLVITDDVLRYLVSRSARDTSELFEILDKIDKASLVEKRKITIPFLQGLLGRC